MTKPVASEDSKAVLELLSAGRFEEAVGAGTELIGQMHESPDGWHLRAMALRELKRYEKALEDMFQCLERDDSNPIAWLHRGQIEHALGDSESACRSYSRAVGLEGASAEAWFLHGRCRLEQGDAAGGVEAFKKAQALLPGMPIIELYLSEALFKAGMTADAVSILAAVDASAARGSGDALFQMARVCAALGFLDRAEAAYREALGRNDISQGAVSNNLGLLLQGRGRTEEAVACFEQALRDDAHNWRAAGNLIGCMLDGGQPMDALRLRIVELVTRFSSAAGVWAAAGIAWERLRQWPEALKALNRALDMGEHAPYVRRARFRVAQALCDWTHFAEDVNWLRYGSRSQDSIPDAFGRLAVPGLSEADLFEHAVQIGEYFERCGVLRIPPRTHGGEVFGQRLRVGYLSSDFCAHATAYLIAAVLEEHDKEEFEIHCYSLGANDNSAIRHRLEVGTECFHDCSGKDDRTIAEQIAGDEIDILVDLKGYTQNGRPLVLAYRPAPVQVSYLGYPGTTGAPYIDYIIADETVLPATSHQYFSEHVAWIPGTYQCNDDKRAFGLPKSRAEYGLSKDSLVLCCFNNPYKITPKFLDVWCGLLADTPRAVLWLFAGEDVTRENLRREVRNRGVDPARMVFAGHLPPAEHLARIGLADLFLDTLPVNAHTTASDALWMGVPVLTCVGDTFAGRVAASLLKAVDLPEMITDSLDQYEAVARSLLAAPEQLVEVRKRLIAQRRQCRLFDTRGFTRDLEAIYRAMWKRHLGGLPPAHLLRL